MPIVEGARRSGRSARTFFPRQWQVLGERIGWSRHLHPFPATGDHGQHRGS